jgi:hypothetical protein
VRTRQQRTQHTSELPRCARVSAARVGSTRTLGADARALDCSCVRGGQSYAQAPSNRARQTSQVSIELSDPRSPPRLAPSKGSLPAEYVPYANEESADELQQGVGPAPAPPASLERKHTGEL